MSLFDDDFYSPKLPRRIGWRIRGSRRERSMFHGRSRRRWSTWQISFFSSVCSAIAAVLLYSWIADIRSPEPAPVPAAAMITAPPQNQPVIDPYDRIPLASEKVRPAVVSIVNKQKKMRNGLMADAGMGSGIIIQKDRGKALIVTNYHVIDEADELEVSLIDGTRKPAKVIGKDRLSDIAVLEIDDKGIDTVAEIGDSAKLRMGETVIAIGNPLGLGESLSSGIISKTLQIVPISLNGDGVYDWEQEVIQIDAAINEGNSGGALIDLEGRVIGINAMKIADIGVEGIGFALPINSAMDIANSLIREGRVIRPYIGVYSIDLNNPYAPIEDDMRKSLKLPAGVKDGVIVLEAVGPSKKAGLKLNDVIVRLDDKEIGSTLELRKYLYGSKRVGEPIEVTYYRAGKMHTVTVALGDKPEE